VTETPALTLHGIRTCDTVKKARAWLDAKGVAYRFRDYKAEPPARAEIEAWAKGLGWERLLNRAGTTFRKLPDDAKAELDEAKAIALMLAHPSAIRRPLLEGRFGRVLGFDPDAWNRLPLG
jgi:Spx/MgsR family transcriptional regulator